MARSPPNIHSKVPRRACTQIDLKVTVKVKGHVIRHFCHVTKIAYSHAQIARSQPNLHTMFPGQAGIQGLRKVKVEVKGHVIQAVSSCHKNCYFSPANGSIATKHSHKGPRKGLQPECPQGHGQGQRSRNTGTFVLSRKSLILARKLLHRHQTCTQCSPGRPASGMCSRSRSRSTVT